MPKTNNDQLERYYAQNRQEWREWLEQNAATSPGVWLVNFKKKSGKPQFAHAEAVEEALCYGWIDSLRNTLDHERYIQMFTPRKPKSPWSKLNKQRIEKLIEQGLMTPRGLEVIEAAKKAGFWDSYDAIEDLAVPDDLKTALAANEAANQNFTAFSNSAKKQILWGIESAKRAETRQKRVEQIVQAAAQNKNPLQYNPNKNSEK